MGAGLSRAPRLRAQHADFHRFHAIQQARESKLAYFGIRLGMQGATIDYARNVCGLERADSTEFEPYTPHRVTHKLRELLGVDQMSGTMRLGAWRCRPEPGSFAYGAYGDMETSERHGDRYEFNCEDERTLTAVGLGITDRTRDGTSTGSIEAPEPHWFLGCQFHPGFESKPLVPHPLCVAFTRAAWQHRLGVEAAPEKRCVAAEVDLARKRQLALAPVKSAPTRLGEGHWPQLEHCQ